MMIEIECRDGETILQACRRLGLRTNNICGGGGICGKCKVKMKSNVTPPSNSDDIFFSKEELQEGFRLACSAKPKGPCIIELEDSLEEEMKVVADNLEVRTATGLKGQSRTEKVLVIDVGTTTIAMQLVCRDKKENIQVIDTYTAVNGQRKYGADVISRIQAANQGLQEELKECILVILAHGIEKLLKHEKVEQILIAGNTTMVHLLMGYSCETLGMAPFKPVTTDFVYENASSLFGSFMSKECADCVEDTEVVVFPGISAFVGGDILAGLFYTEFYKKQEVQLLIDLGTNGEMVIGNRMRMLATSTAAGPAFEGGGLSCGCAGIKGAICGGTLLSEGQWQFETIGNEPPIGICGSGIIEVLYELLKAGKMDATGLLAEGNQDVVYLHGDDVYITQQDIRQFQMAKGAVRAGVETLIKKYGVEVEEISQIYIAGGFGYYLNLEKSIDIGLFPKQFHGKMTAIGNTSLAGLKNYFPKRDDDKLMNIKRQTVECSLAGDAYFKKTYMDYMYFPGRANKE